MSAFRIRELAETKSTNDDVKKAAEKGEPEGLVIWAKKQTAGRGRHGRQWDSPVGNLYASVLLRPECEPALAPAYGFAASLAIRDAVHAIVPGVYVKLKWPNDVLADGKKISGMLLEASQNKKGVVDWLVIGIGVNVNYHPENTMYPSISLQAMLAPAEPKALLDHLLERLAHWKEVLEYQGFSAIREAWLQHAQKGDISVRLPDRVVEGKFCDIDTDGNLMLQLADGTNKAIATGDVFFA